MKNNQGKSAVRTTLARYNIFKNAVLSVKYSDLTDSGIDCGDSVDVKSADGVLVWRDVPFYDGYYAQTHEPMVSHIEKVDMIELLVTFGSIQDEYGIQPGTEIEISLNSKGKYAIVNAMMNLSYSDRREDFPSDDAFANAREIRIGKLKERTLFRSCSPFDNTFNRADFASAFAERNGVKCILNLADTKERLESRSENLNPFLRKLYYKGSIVCCGSNMDYSSPEFARNLCRSLAELPLHEGPFLLHCIEGKDRIGYVCLILEALAGSDYNQMEEDYMLSYCNYFNFSKESQPERYDFLVNYRFKHMLRTITGIDDLENVSAGEFSSKAEQFLLENGMTGNEIEALKGAIISKE